MNFRTICSLNRKVIGSQFKKRCLVLNKNLMFLSKIFFNVA